MHNKQITKKISTASNIVTLNYGGIKNPRYVGRSILKRLLFLS